jgi:hypothetical protein
MKRKHKEAKKPKKKAKIVPLPYPNGELEFIKSPKRVIWDVMLTMSWFPDYPTFSIEHYVQFYEQSRRYYGIWRVLGQQNYYTSNPDAHLDTFYWLFGQNRILTIWKNRKSYMDGDFKRPQTDLLLREILFGIELLIVDLQHRKYISREVAIKELEL